MQMCERIDRCNGRTPTLAKSVLGRETFRRRADVRRLLSLPILGLRKAFIPKIVRSVRGASSHHFTFTPLSVNLLSFKGVFGSFIVESWSKIFSHIGKREVGESGMGEVPSERMRFRVLQEDNKRNCICFAVLLFKPVQICKCPSLN